jgi:hypothetical protein
MPDSVRIHFSSAFTNRPTEKQKIRTALEDATGPRSDTGPDVPTWVVIRDDIEGQATYVAHHTPSQFTLTAPSVDTLCRRVDTEMGNDTRYDKPAFRLDGRPDTRPDHGPGPSAGTSPAGD